MKYVNMKTKIAFLLSLVFAAGLLSVPASAMEHPFDVPAVPAASEQAAEIPEPADLYVNGDNAVFTLEGELSVLLRLHVSAPGRVHILTSGEDVSVVLFNEASSEVCGFYSSVNGVMDAPLDAAPGTYLLGFSGWGEVAVLAADELAASAIFADAGVVPSSSGAAAATSDEASDEQTGMKEAPAPIECQASLQQTVSVASILREAGAEVSLVKWISGEMDGRLVRAEVNGDWFLTPYTAFDNLELTVRAADSTGADTVYTLLFSCLDPSVVTNDTEADGAGSSDDASETKELLTDTVPAEGTNVVETEEGPVEKLENSEENIENEEENIENLENIENKEDVENKENIENEEVIENKEITEDEENAENKENVDIKENIENEEITEAEENTETEENSENEGNLIEENENAEEDAGEELPEEGAAVFDPSVPIIAQVEKGNTISVLSIMAEAGAPVNVITWLSGETEGKVIYVNQNNDWLLTPFNYFDSLELSVTATDYTAESPEAASATYTVILTNPNPAAADAESAEEDASPVEIVVSISMERSEGNAIRLFPEGLDPAVENSFAFQWQISMDGEQWVNVDGANSRDYSFTLDETTSNSYWRLVLTEKEATEVAFTA